ncbi:MAG: hypothetical protein KI785_13875, partial [Devosiaceae bacterium]|nr:hypothetical protein [Devosiaceae bacterium MH13]
MRGLLAACLLAVLCGPAAAWEAAPSSTSTRSLAERCSPAPNGLPDGCVAQGAADIARAWYEAPTRRYAHAILGDAIEAGTLAVRTRAGATLRFVLPDNEVFEDRTPRLVDLDGDGRA